MQIAKESTCPAALATLHVRVVIDRHPGICFKAHRALKNRGRSMISEQGVHMYKGAGVHFDDFI